MTSSTHSGSTSATSLLAIPVAAAAWVLTALFPLVLTPIGGVAAAVGALLTGLRIRRLNWLVWLLLGVGIGVGLYFISAAFNILNPQPASGQFGGTAGK